MLTFDKFTAGVANTTTTVSLTHTVNAYCPVIFGAVYNGGSDDLTALTFNGNAMTFIAKTANGTGTAEIYLYYTLNPAAGSYTMQATRTTGSGNFNLFAYSLTGSDITSQPDNSVTNAANAGSITGTLTVVNDSWVVAIACCVSANNANLVAGSNMRKLDILSQNYAFFDNLVAAPAPAGSFSGTISGFTGEGRAIICASVKPGVRAGGNYVVVGDGLSRSDWAN